MDGPGIESQWGARFFALFQTGHGVLPASCTMGTGSFPGVKCDSRGVTLTPYPLVVSWASKGRAIPILPLWAVRPVQSLSACTRGALYLNSVPVQGCTLPYLLMTGLPIYLLIFLMSSPRLELRTLTGYKWARYDQKCVLEFM